MSSLFRRFCSLGALALSMLLASCSGGSGTSPGSGSLATGAIPPQLSPTQSLLNRLGALDSASAKKRGPHRIYVSYYGGFAGGGVLTFTPKGKPTTPTIGESNTVQLIAVDASGKIYVTLYGDAKIQTYLPNGKQTTPTINLGFNPVGVAVDRAGKIYVTDNANNKLTTYNADGSPTTPTITGLNSPYGVAVDSGGKIYIAVNNQVVTYTATGVQTTPTINVNNPVDAAVDAKGKIYVTDYADNTVFTYLSDGTPTSPTITAGLSGPRGIAVAANGAIYVANYGGNNSGGNNVTAYSKTGTLKLTFACCEHPVGIAVH